MSEVNKRWTLSASCSNYRYATYFEEGVAVLKLSPTLENAKENKNSLSTNMLLPISQMKSNIYSKLQSSYQQKKNYFNEVAVPPLNSSNIDSSKRGFICNTNCIKSTMNFIGKHCYNVRRTTHFDARSIYRSLMKL